MGLEQLKKEYNRLENEQEKLYKEKEQLKQNDVVQRYLALEEECNMLNSERVEMYKQLKLQERKEELEHCHHVWISYSSDLRGKTIDDKVCVKCGLSNNLDCYATSYLNEVEETVMKQTVFPETTEVSCHTVIPVYDIYKELQETFPNASDEILFEIFKAILKKEYESEVSVNGEINEQLYDLYIQTSGHVPHNEPNKKEVKSLFKKYIPSKSKN